MSKKSGLTAAQERELEFLYSTILRTFTQPYNKTSVKVYEALVDMGYAKCERGMGIMIYTLTSEGLQLARALFDSTPDPDNSEPITEDMAQAAIDDCVMNEIIETFTSEPVADAPVDLSPVVAETETPAPVASKPVSGVMFSLPHDRPRLDYSELPPIARAWTADWLLRQTFSHNAPQSHAIAPFPRFQANKVLDNMQRQDRAFTGKMRKVAYREWLAKQGGEKVLEIVSHIETPLTGRTERRVA